MERRERLVELDYFNAAACLMVMLIHVLSLGVTELDRGSWQAAAVYLPWRLAAFAVVSEVPYQLFARSSSAGR